MAGGPTTVELAMAAARAGAFAFLAAGNKAADEVAGQVEAMSALGAPFGVNLFVPPRGAVDAEAFRAYAAELQPEADVYGLVLDALPVSGDDEWRAKVDLLVRRPVPVVSLTFGLPDRDDVEALRRTGSVVLATVTSTDEARAAERLGVDGLVVQGIGAGGHSAVHDPRATPDDLPTGELVRRVRRVTALPLVAAGGVDGPAAVRELLAAGAESVAVGTLLLRTEEAGTSPVHRAALAAGPASHGNSTVLTRAFTGRPARTVRNGFVDRHDATAPTGYPEVHYLTRPLRQAAARAGDAERLHLWAGTGHRSAPDGPAADVIAWLSGA